MAVELESLIAVSRALEEYAENVTQDIAKMADAAVDCHDNMEKDEYSKKAINNLKGCLEELKKATVKAIEVKEDIDELIKKIRKGI